MSKPVLAIAGLVLRASPLILLSPIAAAYVGPGAGLSALGSILALVGSFFLLFVGFLWYPIKRVFRRNSKVEASADDASDSEVAVNSLAAKAEQETLGNG